MKAHNLIDDYGDNDLDAQAKLAALVRHDNDERLHAALGYMSPAKWHRGQPNEVREERARRLAAARAYGKTIHQQRLTEAA